MAFRFGSTRKPELYFAGPWWMRLSPFESLRRYAERRGQAISIAARTCLAIDSDWSDCDVLVTALLAQSLGAWAGTPKAQSPKYKVPAKKGIVSEFGEQLTPDLPSGWGSTYKGYTLKPDREITQLYIPGLGEQDPGNPNRRIWESAFAGRPWTVYLPSRGKIPGR